MENTVENIMSHSPARSRQQTREYHGFHYESIGSDLLESILGVLFQLTEEGNLKLVSDKQQLGTSERGRRQCEDTPLKSMCVCVFACMNPILPDVLSC